MKTKEQVARWYFNYTDIREIYNSINEYIENGWRVHTCLERHCDVIIIYERDLETWN